MSKLKWISEERRIHLRQHTQIKEQVFDGATISIQVSYCCRKPVLYWILDIHVLYLSYAPPAYEYGTRPFLRWVRSLSRSPDASSSPKNASGPIGIPLFGAPGDEPHPFEEGLSLEGDGPLRLEVYPVMRHTRLNRAARNTAGQSAYHQLEKNAPVQDARFRYQCAYHNQATLSI